MKEINGKNFEIIKFMYENKEKKVKHFQNRFSVNFPSL